MAISFFPLTDTVFGLTYEAHIKKYWTFFLSIPENSNPLAGHEQCTYRQNLADPVFYLPCNLGGQKSISCEIPSGKCVFIPVICIVIVYGEKAKDGRVFNSIQQMHNSAYKDQESVVEMELKINDTTLNRNKLRNYRVHTREFQVLIPPGGLYNEGNNPAISDGHYVITKPLNTGTYRIKAKGNIVCANSLDCFEPNFDTEHAVTLKVR
jgi:hypothetical protein